MCVKCSTRRVIHMALHNSRKVSDPLENPANSQIQYYFFKKPRIHAVLHVVLNLLVFADLIFSNKFA